MRLRRRRATSGNRLFMCLCNLAAGRDGDARSFGCFPSLSAPRTLSKHLKLRQMQLQLKFTYELWNSRKINRKMRFVGLLFSSFGSSCAGLIREKRRKRHEAKISSEVNNKFYWSMSQMHVFISYMALNYCSNKHKEFKSISVCWQGSKRTHPSCSVRLALSSGTERRAQMRIVSWLKVLRYESSN